MRNVALLLEGLGNKLAVKPSDTLMLSPLATGSVNAATNVVKFAPTVYALNICGLAWHTVATCHSYVVAGKRFFAL